MYYVWGKAGQGEGDWALGWKSTICKIALGAEKEFTGCGQMD